MIDIGDLTEDEGFALFRALLAKFDWTGTVTALGDVVVYPEGEEPWWGESGLELTPAMREAVINTYEWSEAIPERCAEAGNDLAPKVEVRPDGSFVLHTEIDAPVRFNPDGTRETQ